MNCKWHYDKLIETRKFRIINADYENHHMGNQFRKGKLCSDESKRKNSESHSGRKWYNDGTKSFLIYESCDYVDFSLLNNGRLKNKQK